MDAAQAKMAETGEEGEASAAETGGAWSKAGLIVGAAVVAIGALAVDLGMKYQSSTASLAANADISSAAATKIGNAFLGQAFTTTFSAAQTMTAYAAVAGQMGLVAGKALDQAQALKFMTAAQDLAEASGTSLASATSDLSKTMQAFGIPLSGTTQATNDLFNAARLTGQSVDTFSAGIDKARASMGAAAPPLSALSGLVVDLAAHGETGRQAISALNSAFTGIITPTAAVTKAQKDMGVSFLNSKGGLDDLSTIFTELQPKLADMTATQAAATLKTLGFGSASVKLAETIQAGPAALAKYTAQVSAAGSAHAAAGKNADTMEGSEKRLQSGVEDLLTSLGQKLTPALTGVMNAVTNVVTWFDKNKAATTALVGVVGTLAVIMTAYAIKTAATAVATAAWSVATGIASVATGVASVAVGVFNAVMDANPIAIIVLAIAALGAGIVLLVTHFKEVTGFLQGPWGTAISAAIAVFMPFIGIPMLVIGHWQAIITYLKGVWTTVKTDVGDFISGVVKFFTDLPGNIVTAIKGLYSTVGGFISGVWTTVKTDVGNFIAAVVAFFTGLPGNIVTAIVNLDQTVGGFIRGVWNTLVSDVSQFIGKVIAFFTDLPGNIVTAIVNLDQTVGGFIRGVWTTVTTDVGNFIGGVVTWFTGLPGKIVSGLGDLLTLLSQKGQDIITGLWTGCTTIFANVTTWFQNIGSTIKGWLSDAGTWLFDIGKSIITGLLNGIKNAMNDVKNFVGNIAGDIMSWKGPLDYDLTILVPHGNAIMEGLTAGIQQGLLAKVKPALASVSATIATSVMPTTSVTSLASTVGTATSGTQQGRSGTTYSPVYYLQVTGDVLSAQAQAAIRQTLDQHDQQLITQLNAA